jgi:guanylate kinase
METKMEHTKIIICGQGSSGKDYLKKKFLDRGMKQSISYTTRPPRTNERDGVDYHFVDEETFKKMIDRMAFREWNIFGDNKWYYGTTNKEFNDANLFIMTPSGIKALTPEERAQCFVIFLDIPEEVRFSRLKKRNDADDPERRIISDRMTFAGFEDYDMQIINPYFDPIEIYAEMKHEIK